MAANHGKTYPYAQEKSVLRTSMINLSDFAGQSIQLAFTLETDESNNYNGWSIKKYHS